MFIINMFRASLCPSSGEQDVCYCTWCAALVLLDVVGSGCGTLRCRVRALWRLLFDFTVLAPYNAASHNRYQPHPTEPAQHTMCSNTRLVLLKMGILMPETCWESVDNKHLTVTSCWFSLSLHNMNSNFPCTRAILSHLSDGFHQPVLVQLNIFSGFVYTDSTALFQWRPLPQGSRWRTRRSIRREGKVRVYRSARVNP